MTVSESKPLNKKAVAQTGLSILGILAYLACWILAFVFDHTLAGTVFYAIALAPILIVGGIIILAVLAYALEEPIKAIYNFWDNRE